MKITILQKNGKFSGFEFLPEDGFDNLKIRNMEQRLRNLEVPIKLLEVEKLKEESLIVRVVPI